MNSSLESDLSRLFLFTANRAVSGHVSVELGFDNKSGRSCVQSQFLVDITDIRENRVVFCFPNTQPDKYSITDICFHDDGLLGAATIMGSISNTNAGLLQGSLVTSNSANDYEPESQSLNFNIVSESTANSGSATHTDIHGWHGSWVIIFDLESGAGFADIMYALSKGSLRMTIKVKDLETGNYKLLTNERNLTLGQSRCPQQSGPFTFRRTA